MTGETIHATTIAIAGESGWQAVLLTGRSGSGKSDLALRLIDRGARLVADDYTELGRDGCRLLASAPATIAGRIEVRGIGIVAVPHLSAIPVRLAIALDEPVTRMPERSERAFAGVAIPHFGLAAFEASAPVKVEWLLRQVLGDERETIA